MKGIFTAGRILIIIILLSPFCSKGSIIFVPPYIDSLHCAGDTFSIGYDLTSIYNGSNTFSVLLSNASGSFASPIIIGTKADSVKGTIFCTIPANIISGGNYRIKIFSSSPFDSSANNGYPVSIFRVPAPVATANPGSICVGDSLKLFATDSLIVSYSWTGPAGFSSSVRNPVRPNAQLNYAGNYFVTASIASCSTSSFVSVNVKPLPAKPVASYTPAIPCTGDTLKLTATTTTPGVIYNWIGPGFASSLQNPAISNIDTTFKGDYMVTVTLNGCNSNDTTTLATMKLSPELPAITTDSLACSGKAFHLFANTMTTGVTYNWTGPPAFSDTTQNPVINNLSAANTGNFVVTVTKAGCTATNSIFIGVLPSPVISAVTATGDCEGDTLKLHTSSTSSGTYFWASTNSYTNTTTTGDIARPNASTTYNGTYFVVLRDSLGCTSDTGSAIVVIKPKPAVPSIQTNSPVCEGHALFLNGSSTTSGVTYGWTGPGGFSFSNSQVLFANAKPSISGTYIITVTLAGCSSSSSVNAVINPSVSPDVTITADQGTVVNPNSTVMFTAHALNAGSNPKYQWRRNDAEISGATSDVYLAAIGKDLLDHDQLSVRVISSETCPFPDTVTSYIFMVTVNDLSDADVTNEVTVYPDPGYGQFTIKGTVNTNSVVEVRIINIVGQLIYKDLVIPAHKHIMLPVDITGAASGVYLLQLKAGEQLINKRFSVR